MPVNLQRHTGRNLSALEKHLQVWFSYEQPSLGRVVGVDNAHYVEGAGSANETIVASCLTVRQAQQRTRGIVIRLTVPSMAAYLDVDLPRQARILQWVGDYPDDGDLMDWFVRLSRQYQDAEILPEVACGRYPTLHRATFAIP